MGWLKSTWHDPVASKIIATGVLGLLGWLAWAFRSTMPTAWHWTVADIRLSRIQVIGWFALGFFVGAMALSLCFRRVVRSSSEQSPGLGETENSEREQAPPGPVLTDKETSVIHLLVLCDGRPVLIGEIKARFGWGLLETSQVLRSLSEKGLSTQLSDGLLNELTHNVRIRLTEAGTDYADRNGMLPTGSPPA
jgi:hypothetical protein